MRTLVLTLLAAAAPLRAEDAIAPSWAASAGRPAFRAVQAVADGVYELAGGGLLKPLLPEDLRSRLDQGPGGDSYDAFAARLRERQERAARRDLDSRPGADASPAA